MGAEIGEMEAVSPAIAAWVFNARRHGIGHNHRVAEQFRHVLGAGDLVHGAADDTELEPIGGAGIAEHYVAEMDADAEGDARSAGVAICF